MIAANHEDDVQAAELQPYYARRNEEGYYTWKGEKLPSVTTILGVAPGQHLMSWYAKMAAMKCAAHLVQAGFEPPADEKLQDFCTGLLPRSISKQAALDEIFAWAKNMREAERYRDHKARIGSVCHHAVYEHALGVRIAPHDMEDYLRHVAIKLNLWQDPQNPDFAPTEAMVCECAGSAHAYFLSALEWIEKFEPEWDMIGQEAVVIRPDTGDGLGYAGTVDFIAAFSRQVWERHDKWPWGDRTHIKLTGDFKTSNSLSKSVQAQVEAYANASFIGLVATGQEFPIPETEGIAALHIGPHSSMAGVTDEFGTLAGKAKVIGARIVTWNRNPETYEAFLGLVRWFRWSNEVPRAHQQRQRAAAAPKPQPGGPRPCPF